MFPGCRWKFFEFCDAEKCVAIELSVYDCISKAEAICLVVGTVETLSPLLFRLYCNLAGLGSYRGVFEGSESIGTYPSDSKRCSQSLTEPPFSKASILGLSPTSQHKLLNLALPWSHCLLHITDIWTGIFEMSIAQQQNGPLHSHSPELTPNGVQRKASCSCDPVHPSTPIPLICKSFQAKSPQYHGVVTFN